MICLDPDFLGVFPAPLGSRIIVPEKPWASQGKIRIVRIHPADDPILCLSFTVKELALVLKCVWQTLFGRIARGTFPCPIFACESGFIKKSVGGDTVYLLPEVEILIRSVVSVEDRPEGRRGIRNFVKDPEYMSNALREVRALITERIEL